ncbi:GMP synthase-Glutamine amidotransferase [Amphibacillus marinus]|uniref:GMP synthase-Glutamine amidotransferase n=1 Tax=Amphibacillus marinus TaxID=872970 RepID=A0A1H8KY67_9BACI|nr:type 1 glutamine amidotransferase [Amphibacillus marinus]SEN97870.1 GMP synthase-Glutamine amidotransferase [Amphibacillus marinus]
MRIHVLQHVEFEGLAAVQEWIKARGFPYIIHRLDLMDPLPEPDEVDMLISLGGPMSANDAELWLSEERLLIQQLIKAEKPMVGICLGAQQIAKALGANIFQGKNKEVGWHPIQASCSTSLPEMPNQLTVFHWHGEQFDLPKGAVNLFHSAACANQGFLYQERVLGLQFHFESTQASIDELLRHDSSYIDQGQYVQSAEVIRNHPIPTQNKQLLFRLLDRLIA